MGLNAVITVAGDTIPRYTYEELAVVEARFWEHVCQRFPLAESLDLFGCSIDHLNTLPCAYDFDIRYAHYGEAFGKAGYTHEQMEEAIRLFVSELFSTHVIVMEPYFCP